MSTWTRRRALPGAAELSISPLLFDRNAASAGTRALQADPPVSAAQAQVSRPLVHVTDLFRPHDDPDNPWDLPTVYALTFRGHLDLLGNRTLNRDDLPVLQSGPT